MPSLTRDRLRLNVDHANRLGASGPGLGQSTAAGILQVPDRALEGHAHRSLADVGAG